MYLVADLSLLIQQTGIVIYDFKDHIYMSVVGCGLGYNYIYLLGFPTN